MLFKQQKSYSVRVWIEDVIIPANTREEAEEMAMHGIENGIVEIKCVYAEAHPTARPT